MKMTARLRLSGHTQSPLRTCFTAVVIAFLTTSLQPGFVGVCFKCQGECHAVKAALCNLGDPGWGDPWFPH